jgi:chemotaxis protein MotB
MRRTDADDPVALLAAPPDRRAEPRAPLWLVTFTDVMALMLTFFVMLYAMAIPNEVAWRQAKKALADGLAPGSAGAWYAGPREAAGIATDAPGMAAQDVDYLYTVLATQVERQPALAGARLSLGDGRLVLSLPAEVLFAPGDAALSAGGKRALWALAVKLSRIQNRIALVGHADPRPVGEGAPGPYATNRALSLARAVEVAAFLRRAGYTAPIEAHGAGAARFEEMDAATPLARRLAASRRVDIVILDEGR